MYTITITKNEANPNYDKKREQNRYSGMDINNLPTTDVSYLQTTLTDEEFQAVKKAVLSIM